jgi:hypothetical protein
MTAIVFYGPSIGARRVNELIAATHAGPIKRGDLLQARTHDIVIILDGEFGQNLSVSPKEILTLLDAGKTVIGAASMGALRASELDRYGMIGVGWIYQRFQHEPVRRDDDVAMLYSPVDGQAMTVPLVNVEYWLEWLDQRNYLVAGEALRIRRAAQKIFFAERTDETLHAALSQTVSTNRLDELLRHTGGRISDIKAQDAEAALRFAASLDQNSHFQSGIVCPII